VIFRGSSPRTGNFGKNCQERPAGSFFLSRPVKFFFLEITGNQLKNLDKKNGVQGANRPAGPCVGGFFAVAGRERFLAPAGWNGFPEKSRNTFIR
jgi:hypothetical protein